jgi:hypothetical protein
MSKRPCHSASRATRRDCEGPLERKMRDAKIIQIDDGPTRFTAW